MLDELKNNLCEIINNSNLPVDAVYYVMKDIMHELDRLHENYIEQRKSLNKDKEAEE